jgi:hypothetical protein
LANLVGEGIDRFEDRADFLDVFLLLFPLGVVRTAFLVLQLFHGLDQSRPDCLLLLLVAVQVLLSEQEKVPGGQHVGDGVIALRFEHADQAVRNLEVRPHVVDELEVFVPLPGLAVAGIERVETPQRRGADQQQADDHRDDLYRHFPAQGHRRRDYSRSARPDGIYGKVGSFCARTGRLRGRRGRAVARAAKLSRLSQHARRIRFRPASR